MRVLSDLRRQVTDVCQRMSAAGLVAGTSGNVSARGGDLVAVSPSGLDYADLTEDLVGVHRLDGTAVEAPLQPTSEMPLHLGIYAATDAMAIVHTHSLAATTVSVVADELPAVHYQVAMFGGVVRVSRYATYGTPELAANVTAALRDRNACIMGNHGAVTIGPDLATAYNRAVYLEWVSELYLRARAAGTPRLLPDDEIARVAARLAAYGQQRPRV